MILLESGYLQDGLKAIIYLIPFIYLIVRRRYLNLKYFWLFFAGLFLLFFGNVLDFLDELEFLRQTFNEEHFVYLQDFLEDIIGFTLGFAILILAIYKEWGRG